MPSATATPSRPPATNLLVVAVGYLLMMVATYIVVLWDLLWGDGAIDPDALVRSIFAAELADTILVLAMLALIPRPPRYAAPRAWRAWIVAPPLLGVVLAFNFGYQYVLRSIVRSFDVPIPELPDLTLAHGWWTIALVCLQPALIEELMFRHLFMGHLRPQIGLHGAIWVSAAAFALAHVGRGVGWPLLAIIGAYLGYARAYSGTLILPMILHFLHNLAVLWVEGRYKI